MEFISVKLHRVAVPHSLDMVERERLSHIVKQTVLQDEN